MDQSNIVLSTVELAYAKVTEAVIPVAGDLPALLVGFVFHVNGLPHYRVLTARGNLYNVHMGWDAAEADLERLAAVALARMGEGDIG
jgi:hypothetical protein